MKKLLLFTVILTVAISGYAKKNVIFLMADDFNYWTSKHGYYPQAKTPHLDALANKGVFFRDAHCSSPVCLPSRNALWSGLRPTTTNIDANGEGFFRDKPGCENAVSMNQFFKENGYFVYGAGKLYHPGKMGGKDTDPDNWSQLNKNGSGCGGGSLYKYCNSAKSNYCFSANPAQMTEDNCNDFGLAHDIKKVIEGYSTSANADKPFFIACGFFRPHMPWNSPKYFWDLFDYNSLEKPVGYHPSQAPGNNIHQDFVNNGQWMRAIQGYLASCALADSNVGVVMDALNNSPHKDSTIVLFMGDHGWHLGEKGRWGKFSVDDQANHTTLIIYDPTAAGNGEECIKPVSLQDIYPTLVELCGFPKKENIEGSSLKPLLDDPDDPTIEGLAFSTYNGKNYIKTPQWRLIDNGGESQLYNNIDDPYHWTNLYGQAQYNDVVVMLRNKMDSLMAIGDYVKSRINEIPPAAPGSLSGIAINASQIDLSWKDNSDNEAKFRIYRQTNGSGDFTAIDSVNLNVEKFTDNTVTEGNTYAYYIEAANDFGTTQSNTVAGLIAENTAPEKVKLNAFAVSESEIQLSWKINKPNVDGILVYRAINDGDFEEFDDLLPEISGYSDTDVSDENSYSYYVGLYNALDTTNSDTVLNITPESGSYNATAYEGAAWSMPGTNVTAWKYDKVGAGNVWAQDTGVVIGLTNSLSNGAGQNPRGYDPNIPYEAARWNGGSVSFRNNGQWARYTCNFSTSDDYTFKVRGRSNNCTMTLRILNPADLNVVHETIFNYPTDLTDLGAANANTNWYLANSDLSITSGTYVVEVKVNTTGQGTFGEFTFVNSGSTPISNINISNNNSYLLNNIVSDGYLNLDLRSASPTVEISIFDMNGKEVQNLKAIGEEMASIELNHELPAGTYFISVNGWSKQVTERFIIQK